MLEINVYNDFLKDTRSVARLDWSGRLFQSLAPLHEKFFWPFEEILFGILRSVAVFLKLFKELVEFAINKSIRYCGASPLIDLKTMICDPNWIISLIVFQLKVSSKGSLGAS